MNTQPFKVNTYESKHVQWCFTIRNKQTNEIVGEGAGYPSHIQAIYAAQTQVQTLVENYHITSPFFYK